MIIKAHAKAPSSKPQNKWVERIGWLFWARVSLPSRRNKLHSNVLASDDADALCGQILDWYVNASLCKCYGSSSGTPHNCVSSQCLISSLACWYVVFEHTNMKESRFLSWSLGWCELRMCYEIKKLDCLKADTVAHVTSWGDVKLVTLQLFPFLSFTLTQWVRWLGLNWHNKSTIQKDLVDCLYTKWMKYQPTEWWLISSKYNYFNSDRKMEFQLHVSWQCVHSHDVSLVCTQI